MSNPNQKTLRTKVEKEYPDFTTSVQGLSVKDLESRLVTYDKQLEQTTRKMEQDIEEGDLGRARAKVSLLEAPYNDIKKAVNLKKRYIIKLIEEKGGNIDVATPDDNDEE